MDWGLPLFGIEFFILFDLIVDGLWVIVCDIFIDDFLLVFGEELLNVRTVLFTFIHHSKKPNQIK
jgi:hypothetical protein